MFTLSTKYLSTGPSCLGSRALRAASSASSSCFLWELSEQVWQIFCILLLLPVARVYLRPHVQHFARRSTGADSEADEVSAPVCGFTVLLLLFISEEFKRKSIIFLLEVVAVVYIFVRENCASLILYIISISIYKLYKYILSFAYLKKLFAHARALMQLFKVNNYDNAATTIDLDYSSLKDTNIKINLMFHVIFSITIYQ